MNTFLLYDDSVRSPELRHEIAEAVPDPMAFIERDGRRVLVGSSLERSTFEAREDVVDEFWTLAELGAREIVQDRNVPDHLVGPELVRRALERAGADHVVVPPTFPVGVSDYLRLRGIEVEVDPQEWRMRRRHKTPWQLEGIERAQRAADTAMLTAARMLRESEPTSDRRLRFEGEVVTAELVREAMIASLLSQGAECEEILVQSGDDCLDGHEIGRGPLGAEESVIIDCFPRDRRTGAFTDMTRTFTPGRPTAGLGRLHEHCRRALDIAFECLRPGRRDAFGRVAEYFESQGFPTQRTHEGREALVEGFSHSLGHGVGLEVHEPPSLGLRADELIVGDVVAVEPGLYFAGVGGVRLEDTVLVTEEGASHFTDPFPYDLEP